MNPIYLTEKQLESLMTGTTVSIEGPLNFATKIVPPDDIRDHCHVSWSLHRAVHKRLNEDLAIAQRGAKVAFERIDELEAALAQLRLNTAYNA